MIRYYVNKSAQANGDHEVHKDKCIWLPLVRDKLDLGDHLSPQSALYAARKIYRQCNGCYYCSPEIHTG